MTSSISFYKLLKEDAKKRAWLFWLFAVIFLIVLPVAEAIQVDSVIFWSSGEMKYVREWFAESVMGNGWMNFAVVIGAMLGAVSSFAYLHVREQVDFYHSLPVKREKWFAVSYMSSFLNIMIPCVCGYAIRYVIGMMKGVAGPEAAKALVFAVGMSLICYHIIYLISAIGMILTGKMLSGILMILFLQMWGAFVLYLKETVMGSAFETYLSLNDATGIETVGPYLFSGHAWEESPLFLYYRMFQMYREKDNLFPVITGAVLAGVALAVLAVFLYKIRPSESAGKPVAFPILEPVIKVLVSVSVGIFFVYMAVSQYELTEEFPAWLFVIGILATVFMCIVTEFIYSGDLKMMLKRKVSFGISVLGTAILCAVFQFDMLGYDSYLPQKKEIAAMSVNLLYQNPELFGNSFIPEEEKVEEELEKLQTEDFDQIYKVAQNGISYVGTDREQWDDEKYVPVKVACYLKNGRTVYRKYFVDHREIYRCMDTLFADREYRRRYFDVDKLEKDEYYPGAVSMYMGTRHTFPAEGKKLEALMDVYIDELETTPFSVFENADLVAQLQFTDGEDVIEFPVYEEFTKTLELLKKETAGFRKLTAEEISSVTAEHVDEDSKDGELVKKTVEREDIQQVLDSLCYVQTGFLGRIAERDIYITVETSMGKVYNCYIRKGQIPECLTEW